MPGKIGKRRKGRKKKRFTYSSAVSRNFVTNSQVMPDELTTTLNYTFTGVMSATGAGTLNNTVYRGNGLFDPEVVVGGAQPLGFDQLAAFYNRYQVIGSTCSVEYLPDAGSGANIFLTLAPIDTAGAVTGISQAIELPYSKHAYVSHNATKSTKLYSSMTTKKKFGYKRLDQSQQNVSAPVTADPTEQWFWNVGLLSHTTAVAGRGIIKVTYRCRFYDRKDLPRS